MLKIFIHIELQQKLHEISEVHIQISEGAELEFWCMYRGNLQQTFDWEWTKYVQTSRTIAIFVISTAIYDEYFLSSLPVCKATQQQNIFGTTTKT